MAEPKLENGYVRIANELLEALYRTRFTAREYAVVLCIIRWTYGFNRREHALSLRFLERGTGMRRAHISETLKALEAKGVVHVEHAQGSRPQRLCLLADSALWGVGSRNGNRSQSGNAAVPEAGAVRVPETGTKKDKKKTNRNTLREVIFSYSEDAGVRQAWEDFVSMREEAGAHVTTRALELMMGKLDTLASDNEERRAVLHQSIIHGWASVYPLRGDASGFLYDARNASREEDTDTWQ